SSEHELERILSSLLQREQRQRVYEELIDRSGVQLTPPEGWLLNRIAERAPISTLDLTAELHVSSERLHDPLASLIRRAYVAGEPRIARRVLAGVVGIEVDEAAVDLPVADLEHVTPPPCAPLGHPGTPRPVAMLAVAGPLAHDHVAAREDPVEVRVVVTDRLE